MKIKVRAWDTQRNKYWSPEEMARDQLTLMPDGSGFINVDGTDTRLSQLLPHLIPELSIGRTDKNDTEIYQGHIVHIWSTFYRKDWPRAEVYWNDKLARFDLKSHDGIYHDWLPNIDTQGWYCEVIGHIHEKPEIVSDEIGDKP